jgi:hypothetical protein
MGKLVSISKKFFDRYYRNQHPESALRYLPIISLLKSKKLLESKILEVGSGSLGITPYLKKPVDGIDSDFTGPKTPLLNTIKGTAISLPFHKNSYDVVISTDTLEHIPPNYREKAISEMLRVARHLVVIVVPTGTLSQKQDKQLDLRFQKVFKEKDKFLTEHVQNGLPKNDEILVTIDKSLRSLGKTAKVSSKPLLNLAIRKLIMYTWISQNRYVYYTYMKGYLLLLPLLRLVNFGNCYRRMFVVEFEAPKA